MDFTLNLNILGRIIPIAIPLISLSSCEKQQVEVPEYDLFPLHAGNEYFYSYNEYEIHVGAGRIDEKCNLKWDILQKLENDTVTLYEIEETMYNRICYHIFFDSFDTSYPETTISYFTITETTLTNELTFKGWGPFPRYSEKRDTVFESGYPVYGSNYYKWQFTADSGLVHFKFQGGSTHRPSGYSTNLDSLKIFK